MRDKPFLGFPHQTRSRSKRLTVEGCVKMNCGPSPFEYLLNIASRMNKLVSAKPDKPKSTEEESELLISPLSKDPRHY
ncbi:hypothetical protein ES288_D06G170100v1 [Gossypium darwinii]|uniref:Uncharacterized protein n=1 Tax=Gossypium darwinii TaxID=34276 RepID=A0A5D2C7G5_GOSDA|nr:hypothetical protein ES288_D06G170100v1 [Gossypium darwinii]